MLWAIFSTPSMPAAEPSGPARGAPRQVALGAAVARPRLDRKPVQLQIIGPSRHLDASITWNSCCRDAAHRFSTSTSRSNGARQAIGQGCRPHPAQQFADPRIPEFGAQPPGLTRSR